MAPFEHRGSSSLAESIEHRRALDDLVLAADIRKRITQTLNVALLTSPLELGWMHPTENKTKASAHNAFLRKHTEVDKAKTEWIRDVKTHMQAFYTKNNSGNWSVASIERQGIETISKWKPYPTEARETYIRLHALAETSTAS